jgi:hypothetical protein
MEADMMLGLNGQNELIGIAMGIQCHLMKVVKNIIGNCINIQNVLEIFKI